ncbi:MAG: glycosyl hydrolase [Bacteroidota bacterium]
MSPLKLPILISLLGWATFSFGQSPTPKPVKLTEKSFGQPVARHIGPATMSGRITSLDASVKDPRILYVGSAGGGVWKSTNAGTTFKPIFEDHPQAIGAITMDQDHPDTVWVGTGEPWPRNSTSVGYGVYKTTNGGRRWRSMGLEETERISKILIHPENKNTVWVAALGHLWGSNEERGVFMSEDGGKNWTKVLYVDENTGCASLAIDPQNPDILYAGMWDFRRRAYDFRSGGPGSGLYRSVDGGKNWDKVESDAFREGTLGRIAVATSPVKPYYAYAIIEADTSKLYRSADQGESWEAISDNNVLANRPFYFSLLVPDPVDSARLYKPGTTLFSSKDGGEKWSGAAFGGGGGTHSDHHALWIDPNNPDFMYLGTDGGVYVSVDQAKTWRIMRNLPVSQFYHVSFDAETPYNVFGGLQDNGSWIGPSTSPGGINNADWKGIGFGDGFVVLADPSERGTYYWESQGGNLNRYDSRIGERKSIQPLGQYENAELRFNWNTPFVFGQANRKNFYLGSQFLFKSTDQGDTWEKISPDLTTNDPEKQQQESSGGLTVDNSTAENHCTIISIQESPLNEQIIWVGTDDGNLQVTKDGGKSWDNVTANLPDVPEHTWVSYVEPSPHDAQSCFVTLDGHRNGDKNPYVFESRDLGKTWTNLSSPDIPAYCHVIKQDPVAANVLFLGTELGLYISVEGGKRWIRYGGNVPQVSIRDMAIHPEKHDLILATHGRGIMILDDISPLRGLNDDILQQDVAFLPARPFPIKPQTTVQSFPGSDEFTGENPPTIASIYYYLKKRHLFGDLYLEVFDLEGNLLRKLPAGKRQGINRVEFATRSKAPKLPRSNTLAFQAAFGPSLPPGDYKVRLTRNDDQYETTVKLVLDPNSPHTDADRLANIQATQRAYDMIEEMGYQVQRVTELSEQAKARSEAVSNKKLKTQLTAMADTWEARRKTLVATKTGGITGEVRVRERLAGAYGSISSYTGKPTQSQIRVLDQIEVILQSLDGDLDEVVNTGLPAINKKLKRAKQEEISLITREAFQAESDK